MYSLHIRFFSKIKKKKTYLKILQKNSVTKIFWIFWIFQFEIVNSVSHLVNFPVFFQPKLPRKADSLRQHWLGEQWRSPREQLCQDVRRQFPSVGLLARIFRIIRAVCHYSSWLCEGEEDEEDYALFGGVSDYGQVIRRSDKGFTWNGLLFRNCNRKIHLDVTEMGDEVDVEPVMNATFSFW